MLKKKTQIFPVKGAGASGKLWRTCKYEIRQTRQLREELFVLGDIAEKVAQN